MYTPEGFDANVFINCPSDTEYQPLLRAIVFAVAACWFTPCLALMEWDGATVRLQKIQRLIASCRWGIHDISRTALDAVSGLPRFNMPFELGLDMGARNFGSAYLRRKRLLILDSQKYRYQEFLSDIAGQDVAAHRDSVTVAIEKVRNWLNSQKMPSEPLVGAGRIFALFTEFIGELPNMCVDSHLEFADLDFNDYVFFAMSWAKLRF